MQRLFSSFADGWPGGGLLLQRLLTGGILVYCGYTCLNGGAVCPEFVTGAVGALAGALLIAGIWTPVAGVVVGLVEARVAFLSHAQAVIALTLGLLGFTLAMIGPGTWSVDAWMSGRKHIVPPDV